ncbi:MAG: hypothetical protein R3E57_07255 [Porticoccaceae bacterium]
MNRVKHACAALAACLVLGFSNTSLAIEAKHLQEDMETKEASRLTSGMVLMLSYLQYRLGYPERGECVYDWYFKNHDTPGHVWEVMQKYPDSHAEGIVYALAKLDCFTGDKK